MNKTILTIFLATFTTLLLGQNVLAISPDMQFAALTTGLPEEYSSVFSQNDINGWNPCEGGVKDSSLSCETDLPQETIQMLESAGVKEKAQKNMERYKYAEDKTGVPWQAIAALHWREAGMGSGQSISNGQPLSNGGCYTNIDHIQICSDPNEDAEQAAKHLIENAKSVYNVDILQEPSVENYGWAFLAYNRGAMYKCHGDVSYLKSPYAMNYYDKDHWEMKFIEGADTHDCKGNRLNNVGGKTNKSIGALPVMSYLGGLCSGGGKCAELGRLRTEMWNNASDNTKKRFVAIVESEDVGAYEGYMNQALSRHNGDLKAWLNRTCPAFTPSSCTNAVSSINSDQQSKIDEALNGGNTIRFATGNATGGSSAVGAGKIVCVLKDGKCRDDVDYSKENGRGVCSVYSPSADYGECWGIESADTNWSNEIKSKCNSGGSDSNNVDVSTNSTTTANSSNNSGSEDGSNVTIIGDSITVAAMEAIKEKLPQADIHAKACKTVGAEVTITCGGSSPPNESGLKIAKNLKANNTMRDKVAFLLGTNTSGFNKLEEAIQEIGSDRQIYLMSLYETVANHDSQNAKIKEIVDSNPNVSLIDWKEKIKNRASELLADGTHPNSEGQKIFADLIYNAVNSGDCTSHEGDFPQYYQGNYAKSDHENSTHDWTQDKYNGGSFAGNACGPTSAAMLATVAAGKDIYPYDVVEATSPGDYVDEGGVALDKKLGEKYGFTVEVKTPSDASEAVTQMRDYLNKGYMIHTSGCGCTYSPSCGCHFVGIFELKGDQAFLADSSGRGNRWVNFEDFIKSGYHLSFTAIKGNGGGACDGDGTCGAGSGKGFTEGGLTMEQAQKLADYYNSDEVSASKYGLPNGKTNCVSFSAFFVQHFTDVGVVGSRSWTTAESGYGARSTVSVLKNQLSFETGTDIKPWSIFSVETGRTYCGSKLCGHTGVVVGVNGDNIITVEAAYPSTPAYVKTRPKSYFVNSESDPFAYATSRNFNNDEMSKIVGN